MVRTAVLVAFMALQAQPAWAQLPLTDVLSFLLTNRSVSTGDFVRDAEAAAATRDTVASFLLAELTAVPVSSPASGFTYRLDPALGIDVRSSNSFGPFLVERSLTAGRGQMSFGVGHTQASFDHMDGRPLRTGTLVATASQLSGDPEPFDTETLTLRLRVRTLTMTGVFGVTDRLDVSAAVPVVNVNMSGERLDTYRGTALLQAQADATVSGLGDVIARVKYNVLRRGGSGLALGGEFRLPTGDSDNLLGTGETVVVPRLVGSVEGSRVGVHGNVGYGFGGLSDELDLAGAVTVAVSSRLTLIGEFVGRRLETGGRLTYLRSPHPSLSGVETIRLSGTPDATTRAAVATGLRWNVAQRWLLNAHVVRPLTSAGLNAPWVGSVTLDYFVGD